MDPLHRSSLISHSVTKPEKVFCKFFTLGPCTTMLLWSSIVEEDLPILLCTESRHFFKIFAKSEFSKMDKAKLVANIILFIN